MATVEGGCGAPDQAAASTRPDPGGCAADGAAGALGAGALFDSMDFGFYYRPDVNRILFHYVPDTGEAPCCYDTIVSESRIASYLGIAKGEIPQREYFGAWRSFPDSCDWSWQETRPVGFQRSYFGERVFDGAYRYNDTRVTRPGAAACSRR